MYELNRIVVANMISSLCLGLAPETGHKTKAIKLIAGGYWVDVGSTRES